MKIDDYYRNVARINLNGSLLALVPAILIVGGDFLFLKNNHFMIFVIPFLLYSMINFQLYIRKTKQTIMIEKNLPETTQGCHTIFTSEHFLLFFYNTLSPGLLLFFPDGFMAGAIKKYREKGRRFSKTYALYDFNNELLCFFIVNGKQQGKIEVYDRERKYLGCLEKSSQSLVKKGRRELLNREGRFVATVEGSPFYMDEQVTDAKNLQIGRLQRGWMPVEWSSYVPDPNTPVLSFSKGLSEKDKLLQLSFLIEEFFIKR
jgi:hypothetical protein